MAMSVPRRNCEFEKLVVTKVCYELKAKSFLQVSQGGRGFAERCTIWSFADRKWNEDPNALGNEG